MKKIRRSLKQLILGSVEEQEYLCTPLEQLTSRLRVFLTLKQSDLAIEVTHTHLFLGYKPLIIGISCRKSDPLYQAFSIFQEVCLSFQVDDFSVNTTVNQFGTDKKCVANLFLKVTHIKQIDEQQIFILEGYQGIHTFSSTFHQLMHRLVEKIKNKGEKNIYLQPNLYKQVIVAYAIPRVIALMSVGQENIYNLFPTDLHGEISNTIYVSALRIKGYACEQVEKLKKVTLSTVPINRFRDMYAMGKNHMRPLKELHKFNQDITLKSHVHQFPLFEDTILYRDLERIDTIDIGIHRLFFYRVLHKEILNDTSTNTLAHIHQQYLRWRKKQQLKTDIFYR